MCIDCLSNIDYLQVYWICIQLNECEVFCIISLVCHRTLVQTRLTWNVNMDNNFKTREFLNKTSYLLTSENVTLLNYEKHSFVVSLGYESCRGDI